MIFKLFFFLLLSCSFIAAESLKSNYYVTNDFVMLSDIVKKTQHDRKLFDIDTNRYTKRVKEKELLQTLHALGYEHFSPKHSYIQFTKKSPINREKLISYVQQFYENNYEGIVIENISIEPRSFIEKLPKLYQIGSDENIHLRNNGIIFIKTIDNKKIFFNFHIRAKIYIYETNSELKRGSELSNLNTQKKSIILDKFRAMPLQGLEPHTLEAKHRLKSGTIITARDVVGLYLIKRGSKVSVTLIDAGISISFLAEATQSGRYGDSISVRKSDGKKIKVVITGKNRAEMR